MLPSPVCAALSTSSSLLCYPQLDRKLIYLCSTEKIGAAEAHFTANKISAKVNAAAATVSVYWHVIQSGTGELIFRTKTKDKLTYGSYSVVPGQHPRQSDHCFYFSHEHTLCRNHFFCSGWYYSYHQRVSSAMRDEPDLNGPNIVSNVQ